MFFNKTKMEWIIRDLLVFGRIPQIVFGGACVVGGEWAIGFNGWTVIPFIFLAIFISLSEKARKIMRRVIAFLFFILYLLMMAIVGDVIWAFSLLLSLVFLGYFFWDEMRSRYGIPRLSRFFKNTTWAISFFCFVVLVSVNIYGSRALTNALSEAKQENCPLTFDQLKSFSEIDKIEESENGGPLLVECGRVLRKKRFSNEVKEYPDVKEMERIGALIEKCSDLSAIMDKAFSFPQLRVPLKFPAFEHELMGMEISHLDPLRHCVDFLQTQCYYFLYKGEYEKAIVATEKIFKIVKALEKEPFLISYLMRISFQRTEIIQKIVESHRERLTQNQIEKLQEIIYPYCIYTPDLSFALASEIMYVKGAASWGNVDPFTKFRMPDFFDLPFRGMMMVFPKGLLKADAACLIRMEIKYMRLARQKEAFIAKNMDELYVDPPAIYLMSHILYPSLTRLLNKQFNRMAQFRCLWIALELRRAQIQSGKLPDSLSAMPETLTLDPFTGTPLAYQKKGEGYLVYGVGENRKDDGGEIETPTGFPKDVGIFFRP